jgi:hypothetical protein
MEIFFFFLKKFGKFLPFFLFFSWKIHCIGQNQIFQVELASKDIVFRFIIEYGSLRDFDP